MRRVKVGCVGLIGVAKLAALAWFGRFTASDFAVRIGGHVDTS